MQFSAIFAVGNKVLNDFEVKAIVSVEMLDT